MIPATDMRFSSVDNVRGLKSGCGDYSDDHGFCDRASSEIGISTTPVNRSRVPHQQGRGGCKMEFE